jgi:inhibitor of KinA sporulation pathway (predicted exonuclease)
MNEHGYLIIDLEATCCDAGTIPRAETEMIEIGAVVADGRMLEIVDEFVTFIRPVKHPRLTPFCTELTSITQEQVDAAPRFFEAMERLVKWVERRPGLLFCSWGDYDRNQFARECQRNGVAYPLGDEHLNLKKQFSERQGLRRRFGMAAALRKAGLPLTGTHHRGIDDARNIARLLPFIVGDEKLPGSGRR